MLAVEAIDGTAVDDGIGERVVIDRGGPGVEVADLVQGLRGRRIDGPVESKLSGSVVALQTAGLRSAGQDDGGTRGAAKEDQQRNRSLGRTKHGPVGRTLALEAGVDHVFRVMRRVG